MGDPLPSDLTTVYVGPRECVSILEVRMAAEGIPTHVEGAVPASLPGVYGGSNRSSLLVPAIMAARAQAIAEREFPTKPAESRRFSHTGVYLVLALIILVVLILTGSWLL